MRTLSCLLLVLAAFAVHAQDATARLRAELEHIHTLDQADRDVVGNYARGPQRDSVVAHMRLQDSLNLARVTTILDSAGWLGADVIGRKANQALFLVIQHGDAHPEVQAEYLVVMREAVDEGRANTWELAMLEDRVAVNHGRPQRYGSQVGWKDGKPFVQPLEDPEHVNERRAAMRMEPLEDYARRFGIEWTPPAPRERVLLLGSPQQP